MGDVTARLAEIVGSTSDGIATKRRLMVLNTM